MNVGYTNSFSIHFLSIPTILYISYLLKYISYLQKLTIEAFGQSFRAVAEVDRIGRLLGFGGHLDFKRWCSGQIVQLKCSNGATKCPI
jgi:hypothetical protein